MLILLYKVSFTYDGLGRCFRFVYIYACIAVFLCCYRFLVNKDVDVSDVADGPTRRAMPAEIFIDFVLKYLTGV